MACAAAKKEAEDANVSAHWQAESWNRWLANRANVAPNVLRGREKFGLWKDNDFCRAEKSREGPFWGWLGLHAQSSKRTNG